jgi:hypothetical protein
MHRSIPNIIVASTHPLDDKIQRFLSDQSEASFEATGLTSNDYLRVIEGEVAAFRLYQDRQGRIIDPVLRREFQYATPCYALAAGFLAGQGIGGPDLLASGTLAMDAAVEEMRTYRTHRHGDFFTYPVMRALEIFEGQVTEERFARWQKKLSGVRPVRLYRDFLGRRYRHPFRNVEFFGRQKDCTNWNIAAVCGEHLRMKHGLADSLDFIDKHLAYQRRHFNELGMYRDPGCPLAYDQFPRHFLASILHLGYDGPHAGEYRELVQRGAWTSLFMQSPAGEAPVGHRSAQHIWNEAQAAVTYEIYATQYARSGAEAEAAAFKRAARLALGSILRWLRPDGSGYVVKNRYPIETRYGYETYSSHSQYNLLAASMLANAFLFADESIREGACPADVGGFVLPILDDFHKIFANAGGAYVEYDTCGDHVYNPTGLLRVHIREGNPQLGPSDGRVGSSEDGGNVCIGPSWLGTDNKWHALADQRSGPTVEVLEETTDRLRFDVVFEGAFQGVTRIRECFEIENGRVTVRDELEGDFETLRAVYPMLISDGLEATKVHVDDASVHLSLRDGGSRFTVLSENTQPLQRTRTQLSHKNGVIEPVYAETNRKQISYSIDLPDA